MRAKLGEFGLARIFSSEDDTHVSIAVVGTFRYLDPENTLERGGVKDEGLLVPKELGAEANVTRNILAGNNYSMAYARTPQEILRIVYGTGHEGVPGGFYPKGGDGDIVKSFLK
ncbi:hypothetical protein PIB30_042082 [Stylosanthes scabra]|uniref:Protein kinase domain-containing protein n=1 Tax=Stylosanthes scabra TaxID=79078 RepID=A0ABU6SFT2_9FABA|nr:hypothetical protein [Stylosanthes scabra]